MLLLNFNKLKINFIIISLLFLILLFIPNYQQIITVICIYLLMWKYKYYFFIKTFIFGFFKTHLVIFYIMSLISIIKQSNYLLQIKLTSSLNLLLLVISFSLGAQWALYLFNWGFYWTNDSIEVILILFIILFIHYMHKWPSSVLFTFISSFFNLFLIITLRSNLIFTKHNFFKQSGTNMLIYLYMYLLFFLIKVFNFCKKYFCYKNVKPYYLIFITHIWYVSLIIFNILNYWYVKQFCVLLFQLWVILFFIKFINFYNVKLYFIHLFFILFLIIFNLYAVTYYFIYHQPMQLAFDQKISFFKNNYLSKFQFIQTYFQSKINKNLNNLSFFNKNQFFYKKLITNFYI